MKVIAAPATLVSQVHEALVSEIAQGNLKPGERVIQEQVAQLLGVSRQPVQQALLLLRNQGVLYDAPGRGLIVAPMDPEHVRHMYDIRAMLEGLAFRRAAEQSAGLARKLGPKLLEVGRDALARGCIPSLIAADLSFHSLVHELSKNPLIAPTMEAQWIYTQRVMGEVLIREDTPHAIWAQHASMLEAVMAGDGDAAERQAREHITRAAAIVVGRLEAAHPGPVPASSPWRWHSEFIAPASATFALKLPTAAAASSSSDAASGALENDPHTGRGRAAQTPRRRPE